MLCSAEELGRLRNPALALAVESERLRLSRLHAHLFRQGDGVKEPAVSLESFVWAHCLVRSRALELTAGLVRHKQIQKSGVYTDCPRIMLDATHLRSAAGRAGLALKGMTDAGMASVCRQRAMLSMSAACCQS